MACEGMIFIEKFSNFRKVVHFILFHLIFLDLLNNLPPPPPFQERGGGDSLVDTIMGGGDC